MKSLCFERTNKIDSPPGEEKKNSQDKKGKKTQISNIGTEREGIIKRLKKYDEK